MYNIHYKTTLGWIWPGLRFGLPHRCLGVKGFNVLLEFSPENICVLQEVIEQKSGVKIMGFSLMGPITIPFNEAGSGK